MAMMHTHHVGDVSQVLERNRSELDSHAATCIAGTNCLKVGVTDRKVGVAGFLSEMDSIM